MKTSAMRISSAAFVVAMVCGPLMMCEAQSPNSPTQGSPAASTAAAPATLQPALDAVGQTVGALRLEKWKRGSVRDEATADISAIRQDLQASLPPLMKDADAAPGTLSKMLPVSRNVDALYDVLLRVVEAARMSAPDEQANQLRQALSTLGNARLAFDDGMLAAATTQEKQVVDLHAAVERQATFKCPTAPAPATPACTPAPARKPRKKPAPAATSTPAKPATTPATGSTKTGP